MPARVDTSLLGRVTDAFGSMIGGRKGRRASPTRAQYNAIPGEE